MAWSKEAKSRAMEHVFGGWLKAGLLTASGEETDVNYERQALQLVWTGPGERSNPDELRFPTYGADARQPVTGWFLVDEKGTELVREAIAEPETPKEGYRPYFAAGELRVKLS